MMSRLSTFILALLAPLALAACVSDSGSSSRRVIDLDSVLPPQSLLRDDTREALAHDRNQSRLAYVGVWAKDSDACAMMDQTAFDGYAVITPETIRQSYGECSFAPGAPGETVLNLEATCKARGKKTSKRTIDIQMLSNKSLLIRSSRNAEPRRMVRCRLFE